MSLSKRNKLTRDDLISSNITTHDTALDSQHLTFAKERHNSIIRDEWHTTKNISSNNFNGRIQDQSEYSNSNTVLSSLYLPNNFPMSKGIDHLETREETNRDQKSILDDSLSQFQIPKYNDQTDNPYIHEEYFKTTPYRWFILM